MFPFKRPEIKVKSSKKLKYGLCFGRRFHTKIYNHVKHRTFPKKKDKVVHAYFTFLRRVGLKPQLAEVSVQSPQIGVATKVDLVCTLPNGTVVFVENKTTQHLYADYMRIYHKTDTKHNKLVNGLPNTEYIRHQMQIGCALSMTKHLKYQKKPRGAVIVCCRDKIAVFWTRDWALKPEMYPTLLTSS